MKKKEIFKTWDNWCLKKLKEIGRSTLQEWGEAMGYKNPNCLYSLVKNNIKKLTVTGKYPTFYEVKKELE